MSDSSRANIAASAGSSKPGGRMNKKANGSPQPTHFLALPLVNAHALPQLSRSINHFQSVTTSPPPLKPSQLQARDRARVAETPERDSEEYRTGADGENNVAQGPGLKIIPAQAHRPAGTLHLTLGTMVLKEAADFQRALEVLKDINYAELLQQVAASVADVGSGAEVMFETTVQGSENQQGSSAAMDAGEEVASALKTLTRPVSPPPPSAAITRDITRPASPPQPRPLQVSLIGLGTFPSAKKSRVFYAAPHDSSGRLQSFAEAVQRRFIDEGVVRAEPRPLTLHATVANLKYVKVQRQWKRGGSGSGGGRQGREVDAREVIQAFGEGGSEAWPGKAYSWAEGIVIDRVRICKMGAVKSEDPVLGMEYPAIRVPVEGDAGEESELAEVKFT
ncbi:uncharacterized protein HMPREF1541_10551 [Cyphellophora europaea CBS 101466]|uniref:A-kinase anchor protein 7-like phosphoesterase domain-containing protein n=1 Tax=Cyphellophora europaea (strain CBS 101466) TaxID=1220924 RepID=W2S6Q7_CYPE1|nr:uncharacterized protein HMPREF1541_10551 [Cyphellophora europaea CBS 101466]ETN44371.1 hypothetical protein HMPREF1541_10551 [Cyphellophora europaea CBS 101466]